LEKVGDLQARVHSEAGATAPLERAEIRGSRVEQAEGEVRRVHQRRRPGCAREREREDKRSFLARRHVREEEDGLAQYQHDAHGEAVHVVQLGQRDEDATVDASSFAARPAVGQPRRHGKPGSYDERAG
ncbi:hypothetical protein CI238_12220, partial [Colletotrichum incanum]